MVVRPTHAMKLIEHLELVIELLERGASHAEIKGALLAMREQLDGADRTMDDKIKLAEENARLTKQLDKLNAAAKFQRPDLTGGAGDFPKLH